MEQSGVYLVYTFDFILLNTIIAYLKIEIRPIPFLYFQTETKYSRL